jgi:hypothetical protein
VGTRRFLLALGLSALVAGPVRSEPVGRDVGTRSDSATFGPVRVELSEAHGFVVDPFVPPTPTWLPPMPTAGNRPPAPFLRSFVPELTLTLRPILGFEPFLHARTSGPFQAASPFGSDFGFRFRQGRFEAGTQLSFLRDDRGLQLDALSYARYVAPTYHFGLSDDARIPLVSSLAPTHRLTASAGLKPAKAAPALRVSTSMRDAGTEPRLAAGMFGTF